MDIDIGDIILEEVQIDDVSLNNEVDIGDILLDEIDIGNISMENELDIDTISLEEELELNTIEADAMAIRVTVNDYNVLLNKPSINDVTLIGNKSLEDLNIKYLTNLEIEQLLKND